MFKEQRIRIMNTNNTNTNAQKTDLKTIAKGVAAVVLVPLAFAAAGALIGKMVFKNN